MANPHNITVLSLHWCLVDYQGTPAKAVRKQGQLVQVCIVDPQMFMVTDDGSAQGTQIQLGSNKIGRVYETGAQVIAAITA